MWVCEDQIVDFGIDMDNLRNKFLKFNKSEIVLIGEDDPEPEKPKLTNCKNCGAPLVGTKCEYFGTEYAPKIEKLYCEEADAEKSVPDSLVVTQENLQNSFFDLANAADASKRALMDFGEEIKMIEAEERILWLFVLFLAAAALIGNIAFVLNLFA